MTTIAGLPLRVLNAGNAGPFTLDGTRTYIVGRKRALIIDPGPDNPQHIGSVLAEVSDAEQVTIVLTHRHPDHAAAAGMVAAALKARVVGTGQTGEEILPDGGSLHTDAGELVAVSTPGHCDAHLSLLWLERRALFCGDLLLGEGFTTWVAGYPTCVADYLESLDRIEHLGLEVVFPTHGPPLPDPSAAIDRFRAHRRQRIAQVRSAQEAHPDADLDQLVSVIYGPQLPAAMRGAAEASVGAVRDYLSQESEAG